MSYELLKALHILGVVLFLGNIIVTGLWKVLADRTRETAIIAFSQRLVTLTDILFTAVGVALLAWTGPAMATRIGSFGSTWVILGSSLFVASGVLWVMILIPVEILQERLARQFRNGGPVPARYRHLSNVWYGVGGLATILPLATVVLMVVKPA